MNILLPKDFSMHRRAFCNSDDFDDRAENSNANAILKAAREYLKLPSGIEKLSSVFETRIIAVDTKDFGGEVLL